MLHAFVCYLKVGLFVQLQNVFASSEYAAWLTTKGSLSRPRYNGGAAVGMAGESRSGPMS